MRRSRRGRSSVSTSADGTQDVLEWRRPRSKSHDRDSGYKGAPVPLSRPTLLMDAVWSGAILGLSLPLGPMLATKWSEAGGGSSSALPGVRLGIWAASLYAGKLGALAAPRLLPPLQALLLTCRSAVNSSRKSLGRRGLPPPPAGMSIGASSSEIWWWSVVTRHACLLAGVLVPLLLALAVGAATSFAPATAARFALGAAHGSFSSMAGSGSFGAGGSSRSSSSSSSSASSSSRSVDNSNGSSTAISAGSSSSNSSNNNSVLSAATGARAFTLGLALGLGSVGLLYESDFSPNEETEVGSSSGSSSDRWPISQAPCIALSAALALHALWARVLSPATAPGTQPLHTALQALCWRFEERGFTCFGLNRGNSTRGAYAAVSSSGDGDSWSDSDDDDDGSADGALSNNGGRYVVLAVRSEENGAPHPQTPQQRSSSSHRSSRVAGAPALDPTEGPVNDFVCPPPSPPLSDEAIAAEAQLWRDAGSEDYDSHRGNHGAYNNGAVTAAGMQTPPSTSSSSRVVPARVLRGVKGDMLEAKRRCAATALWRRAYGVDSLFTGVPFDPAFDIGENSASSSSSSNGISSNSSSSSGGSGREALALGEPQPYFAAIKRYYPHAVHGVTAQGNLVYIEKLGEAALNLAVLQGRVGVTLPQLLRHKVTHEEYMWRVLAANHPQAQAVTVFDLAGLTMASVGTLAKQDACKAVVNVCKEHYVERSSRIFVVNAPFWFTAPWRAISPMLSEATRSKVVICGVGTFGPLYAPGSPLQPQDLPPQYGGTSSYGFGESPDEQRLRALVQEANAKYSLIISSDSMAVSSPDSHGAVMPSAAAAANTPEGSLLPHIQPSSSTNTSQSPTTPAIAASFISSWTSSLPISIAPLASNVLSTVSAALTAPLGGSSSTGGRRGRRAAMLWGSGSHLGLGRSGSSSSGGGAVGAHLGKDNRFTYDEAQGRWVLEEDGSGNTTDGDDDDEYVINGGLRTRRNTADKVMEERLIRAIQAAHGYNGDPAPPSSSSSSTPPRLQPSPPPSPALSSSLRLRAGSVSGASTTGWRTPLASDDGFVSADDGGYFSSDLLSDDEDEENHESAGSTKPLPTAAEAPVGFNSSHLTSSDPILYSSSGSVPSSVALDLEMGLGGVEALTDVPLASPSPPPPPLPAAPATSSSPPPAAPVPTGVLVVHVLWRCLHHAVLHLAAALLVASAMSQILPPPSLQLDLGLSAGDTGVESPTATTATTVTVPPHDNIGSRIAAGACFNGGLLLLVLFVAAEWSMPQCAAKLQANGLAASLRTAVALQVPALLALAALLPSLKTTIPVADVSATAAEAEEAVAATNSELSATSTVLLAAAFAVLLGAHLAANGHKRAWVPSLPDCRRAQCLPAWLLTTAELVGAAAGSAVLVFAGSGWTPASWLRCFAALGLLLGGASSCFGD